LKGDGPNPLPGKQWCAQTNCTLCNPQYFGENGMSLTTKDFCRCNIFAESNPAETCDECGLGTYNSVCEFGSCTWTCCQGNTTYPACQGLQDSVIGERACVGTSSCVDATNIAVGSGSCVGSGGSQCPDNCFPGGVCEDAHYSIIGNSSCYGSNITNAQTCYGIINTTIGDSSCRLDNSLVTSPGKNCYKAINASIGDNSCNELQSCSNMGKDVQIKNNACNAVGICANCTAGSIVPSGECNSGDTCQYCLVRNVKSIFFLLSLFSTF